MTYLKQQDSAGEVRGEIGTRYEAEEATSVGQQDIGHSPRAWRDGVGWMGDAVGPVRRTRVQGQSLM